MTSTASELSIRLARRAEDVCRHYLSNGRKSGRYWLIGDECNTPGQSMHVRLYGFESGPRAAGKWTDQASGHYGDLLDVIRATCAFSTLSDTLAEARRFLSDPPLQPPQPHASPSTASTGPRIIPARRLFHISHPLPGTLAETYLHARAIAGPLDYPALRFHPTCYFVPEHGPRQSWPALIAAISDLSGAITGVHRTYLARDGSGKAAIDEPRRTLGLQQGHAVRFGICRNVLIAGEGIETVLAIRSLLPHIPAAAALSANHLAMLILPPTLQRLYIACDNGSAGEGAAARIAATAKAAAILPKLLIPDREDWNADLMRDGRDQTLQRLLRQLINIDAEPPP